LEVGPYTLEVVVERHRKRSKLGRSLGVEVVVGQHRKRCLEHSSFGVGLERIVVVAVVVEDMRFGRRE
jgi:hypothetical protein